MEDFMLLLKLHQPNKLHSQVAEWVDAKKMKVV